MAVQPQLFAQAMTKAPITDETGSETWCAVAIASGNNVESKYTPSSGAKADVFGSANVERRKHCTMRTDSHELCQTGHMDCTAHSIRRSFRAVRVWLSAQCLGGVN